MRTRIISLVAAVLLAAGCSSGAQQHGGGVSPELPFTNVTVDSVPYGHIKHVVVIIQENRSFDNIFEGFPNADTQNYGLAKVGNKTYNITLQSRDFKGPDLAHGYAAAKLDYSNGKMWGFYQAAYKYRKHQEKPNYPYSYLDRTDSAPYWAMAQQYVLADKTFATEWGASFTAHLDLIAATTYLNNQKTLALVDSPATSPWGCDAQPSTTTPTLSSQGVRDPDGPFPCFTRFATLAHTLDGKHVPWRFYAPPINSLGDIYSSFDSIKQVRQGPDWQNVISPQTKILTDLPKQLAPMTWIVPTGKDSDHPGQNSDTGPSWVADIVNEIGQSSYWNDTAIVVLWDDWGGWYDHVPPPQLDYLGLSFRVPMIVISPYAKSGYVSHVQYEFGSVVKFIENVFNLPSLGFTDARANGLSDAFDFSQQPRKFQKIPCKYPPSHFTHQQPDYLPVDDDSN